MGRAPGFRHPRARPARSGWRIPEAARRRRRHASPRAPGRAHRGDQPDRGGCCRAPVRGHHRQGAGVISRQMGGAMNAKRLGIFIIALLPVLAEAQERKITFMLDFIALGRHAAWYVPIAKGYYKEEGLDVTVVPSKGTADVIRGVE